MTFRVVDRARFNGYVAALGEAVGHADRRWPLEAYLTGLLLPGERKSIEPIAGWVIDETSFPKKGRHSVGVARQYCGTLGKEANCQVAVSVSLANRSVSVPAGWRLYLPKEWAVDAERRERAGVPLEVAFARKWEIALGLIDDLLADDVPRAPVIADSAYGDATAFRDALTERGLKYVLAVRGDTSVWPPGLEPIRPSRKRGGGRPATRHTSRSPSSSWRPPCPPANGARCAGAREARASCTRAS